VYTAGYYNKARGKEEEKMKKIVSILVTFLIIGIMVSGCGKNSVDTNANKNVNSDIKSETSKEITKVEKRVLKMGFGGNLENYTPVTAYGLNFTPVNLVYETLVKYDNGKIVPYLAESWKWNSDKTEITFNLRENVVFHDGEPMNAEAVKLNFQWQKKNMLFTYLKGLHLIKEIEVVDEYAVKFKYDAPYYAVLQDLSSANPVGIVSPKTLDMTNFEVINGSIGTGPYIYSKYDKSEGTTLSANENYWGEAPKYDEVLLKYIPDSNSRIMALENGEIDMIFGSDWISYDDYTQVKEIEGIKGEIAQQTTKTRNILLNAASSILSDLKVREAILYAVNKEDIVNNLMYGYEEVAPSILDKNLPHCNVKLEIMREYNVKKAKELLEEAGWIDTSGDGIREKYGKKLSIKFIYQMERSLNKEIADIIKQQLKKVGIEAETEGLELMTWFQRGGMGQFDMSIVSTYATPNDPQNFISPMITPQTPGDYFSISSLSDCEDFKKKVATTLVTGDDKIIDELYVDILNCLNNNAIYLPISYQKEMVLYRTDKISDFQFGGCSINLDPTLIEQAGK
jgi:peptide/nickel transport system substrate-binding protein/nickel transport system substrate-binding protein